MVRDLLGKGDGGDVVTAVGTAVKRLKDVRAEVAASLAAEQRRHSEKVDVLSLRDGIVAAVLRTGRAVEAEVAAQVKELLAKDVTEQTVWDTAANTGGGGGIEGALAFNPIKQAKSAQESPQVGPVHIKARSRNKAYPERFPVPDEKVSFDQEWPEYKPKFFEHGVLTKFARGVKEEPSVQKWSDPDALAIPEFQAELQKRKTFINTVPYGALIEQTLGEAVRFDTKTGAPLNPRGRTGIVGRGLLGKFGPNHAADPIVTRFHPKDPEKLQFVAIERKDTGDWALPGGMVDPGENTSLTVRREFEEEAGKTGQNALLEDLFSSGKPVYYGCTIHAP